MLLQGVSGITDLITTPGLINLDFADVKSVMANAGSALMGIGSARGEDRVGGRGRDGGLQPAARGQSSTAPTACCSRSPAAPTSACSRSTRRPRWCPQAAHPEANIIFGATIDDALGDEVRVTVIAAGFDGGHAQAARRGHGAAPRRRSRSRPRSETRAAAQALAAEAGRHRQPAGPTPAARASAEPSAGRRPAAGPPSPAPRAARADAVRRRRPRRPGLPEVGPPACTPTASHSAPSTWPSPTGTAGSVRALRLAQPRLGRRRRPEALAPRTTAACSSRLRARRRARRPAPGARRRRASSVEDRRRPAALPRVPTRWSPTSPASALMVRAADCVPVLLADADGRRGRRRPLPGAPAWSPASCPATVDRDARARRRRDIDRLGRAARVRRAATRCPRRCSDEVAARRAGRARRPRRGARRRSTSARASAPSSSATASTCVDVSRLHPRVARPLLLPPRRRRAPAGWPALIRMRTTA